jgi:O-antigen/teichoic acid export membrane protein
VSKRLDSVTAGPAAIRGGALRVAGYVVGSVLAAGSAALLFRHLGVVDTGRYVTAISIVAIVGGLSDLGLTAIGVRELSVREGPARDRLAADLLGLRLVITVAGLLVAVAFTLVAGYGSVLVSGVVLAGTALMAQSVQATLAMSLMSALRLGWVTAADVLRQILQAGIIVALVVAGAGLLAVWSAAIPATLAALVVTVVLVRGSVPLRPTFGREEWRALLRSVLPYSVAVAAASLYFRLAIILVSLMASARELGYFGASFRIIEVLMVIPGLLLGAAFPIFARAAHNDRERLAYAVGRVFDVSLIAGAWFAICLALGAPLGLELIGGSKFAPASEILAIQGLALGGTFVGAVWANALLSLGRHRDILALNVGALLLGAPLVAALVALDGARGAATATAVVEVVLPVCAGALLRRRDPAVFPTLVVLPRVAVAAGIALVPWFITGLTPGVRVLAASFIFAVLLTVLGAVPAELRDELRRERKRQPSP